MPTPGGTQTREEVSLTCMLLKSTEGSFEMKAKKGEKFAVLQAAIGDYLKVEFRPHKLKLWFATTTNDAGKTIWLPDDDGAADKLDDGVIHPHIQTLISTKPLKPTRSLARLMEEHNLDDPLLEQIHVLVQAPQEHPRPATTACDVAWSEPESRPQLVVGEDDKLVRLPWPSLRGTGIGRGYQKDVVLYRRSPLRKQWHEIYRCAIRTYARLWVVGPPGTGKSCAALAFAHALNPAKWNVVWLHYTREDDRLECVRLVDNKKTTCDIEVAEVDTKLKQILDSASPSMGRKTIIFLDGVTKSSYERTRAIFVCARWHSTDVTNRRVVFVCSSLGAPDDIYRKDKSLPIPSTSGNPDDEDLSFQLLEDTGNDGANMEKMTVRGSQVMSQPVENQMLFRLESWRLDEYMEAVRHEDFFQSVENVFFQLDEEVKHILKYSGDEYCKEENADKEVDSLPTKKAELIAKVVEEKYFVAGGSARLMFDLTLESAVEALDQAINKMTDLEQYLLELTGNGPPIAVNRLLARFRNIDGTEEVRLVSSYVVRKVARKLGPELFLTFKEVCQVNPSVDGYVLESWFFSSLGHSDLPVWYNLDGLNEKRQWERAEVIYFDPVKRIPQNTVKPTWLALLKWDQGGFDAVFVNPAQKLVRFVQLTRSDKHPYTAEPFVRMLNLLKAAGRLVGVEMVELCYVVPVELLNEFSLPICSQDFENDVVQKALSSGSTGKVSLCGVKYEMMAISYGEGEKVGKKRSLNRIQDFISSF